MSVRVHVVALVVAFAFAQVRIAEARAARLPVEGPEPAPSRARHSYERQDAASRQGAGLIAAGALIASLGLAANLVRVSLARKLCREVNYDSATHTLSGAELCLSDAQAMLFLGPSALILNTAAFGLVTGGGHVHGRWAAQWSPDPDRVRRGGGVRIGVGAGLLVAGLLGYGLTRGASYVDMLGFNTCSERHGLDFDQPDPTNSPLVRCMRDRYEGYLIGITLTQAASIIGVGVLSQGVSFRRHSRGFEVAARHRLRLQPVLSPAWAGFSLSGRF